MTQQTEIIVPELDPAGLAVHPKPTKSKTRLPGALAIACMIASAAGAALVITLDHAYNFAALTYVPTPKLISQPISQPGTQSKFERLKTPNSQDRQALYLMRSTLLALNQANRTGNYSVLRALGTPRFQTRNSSADLAMIFSNLRRDKIDLAETALLTPHWQHPIRQGNNLHLRGTIAMRLGKIRFNIQFHSIKGYWRIFAISVSKVPDTQAQHPVKPRRNF